MSDTLREALDEALAENKALRAANTKLTLAERDRIEAALSAPQADVEPFGWIAPDGKFSVAAEMTKEKFLAHFHEAEIGTPLIPLYTAPPPQAADRMREALERVRDFMKKDRDSGDSDLWTAEYQELWEIVDEALSRADEGKETEGSSSPAYVPETEEEANELADNGRNTGGKSYYRPSAPVPPDRRELRPGWLAGDVKKASQRVEEWSTPPDPKPWPNGCRNPNSCSIHRDCMYVQCKHYTRDISGEVDAALQRGGK